MKKFDYVIVEIQGDGTYRESQDQMFTEERKIDAMGGLGWELTHVVNVRPDDEAGFRAFAIFRMEYEGAKASEPVRNLGSSEGLLGY